MPAGYRIQYTYNTKLLIAGGGLMALSVTATTLIASGMASSTGFGFFGLPASAVPIAGSFSLAGFGALLQAGDGTVATLIALGTVQLVGFGLILGGVGGRKADGIAPLCAAPQLALAPFASPEGGGLTLRGAL